MIRVADLLFSLIGLIVLSPVILIFALLIVIDDFGSPLYIQERVGINGTTFKLLKLRSMKNRSTGLLISTSNDSRITAIGKFIRKYKIDELPQLLNVLMGSMSIVGPRPEVSKYVRYILKLKEKFYWCGLGSQIMHLSLSRTKMKFSVILKIRKAPISIISCLEN